MVVPCICFRVPHPLRSNSDRVVRCTGSHFGGFSPVLQLALWYGARRRTPHPGQRRLGLRHWSLTDCRCLLLAPEPGRHHLSGHARLFSQPYFSARTDPCVRGAALGHRYLGCVGHIARSAGQDTDNSPVSYVADRRGTTSVLVL